MKVGYLQVLCYGLLLVNAGRVALWYVPTWTSDVDSGGFFLLQLDRSLLHPRPLELAVHSLGSGSRRWFAIDSVSHPHDAARGALVPVLAGSSE